MLSLFFLDDHIMYWVNCKEEKTMSASNDNKDNKSYKSEKRVDMLKKRTHRCVCKYCGGKLKLRQIIFSEFEDARTEIFCSDCDRIEFGVEQEIYDSAK